MTELALDLFIQIIKLLPMIIGFILVFTLIGDLLFGER